MSPSEDQAESRECGRDISAFEGLCAGGRAADQPGLSFLPRSRAAEEMAQEAFCVPTAPSANGGRMRSSPPGCLHWLRTCIVRSYAASRREWWHSMRLPNRPTARLGWRPRDHDRDMACGARFWLCRRVSRALVLFYFHEMDVATAARSLELPRTVKARLSRGREILRRKLPQRWPRRA